jgi:hypothetical protein
MSAYLATELRFFMTDESKLLAKPPMSTETLEQFGPLSAATSRVGVQ